jgi:hypothetical protein
MGVGSGAQTGQERGRRRFQWEPDRDKLVANLWRAEMRRREFIGKHSVRAAGGGGQAASLAALSFQFQGSSCSRCWMV